LTSCDSKNDLGRGFEKSASIKDKEHKNREQALTRNGHFSDGETATSTAKTVVRPEKVWCQRNGLAVERSLCSIGTSRALLKEGRRKKGREFSGVRRRTSGKEKVRLITETRRKPFGAKWVPLFRNSRKQQRFLRVNSTECGERPGTRPQLKSRGGGPLFTRESIAPEKGRGTLARGPSPANERTRAGVLTERAGPRRARHSGALKRTEGASGRTL